MIIERGYNGILMVNWINIVVIIDSDHGMLSCRSSPVKEENSEDQYLSLSNIENQSSVWKRDFFS